MSNSPMSESPETCQLISGGYILLKRYMHEAKVLSLAYSFSEAKFRNLHKWLTYPIILLSSVASVCAGLDINQYALMSISLSILILSGFNSSVNPLDRANRANQMKTEFGEIASDTAQFVQENNKSSDEIKSYSQLIHELLNVWKAQSPPCSSQFMQTAKLECSKRIRSSSVKKKELEIHIPDVV